MTQNVEQSGFPKVAGRCPSCDRETLFLGSGGHVTCSLLDCRNPCAADDALHGGIRQLRTAADNLADAVSVGCGSRLTDRDMRLADLAVLYRRERL